MKKVSARFQKPGWKFQPGQMGWKILRNQNEISARAEKRRPLGRKVYLGMHNDLFSMKQDGGYQVSVAVIPG